jgi:thioester reductase-like protein
VGWGPVSRGHDDEERLIVVAGVGNPADLPHPEEISSSLRAHGYTGPHTIVLVRRQAIKRTTSGKVARGLTREKWLDGSLRTIEIHERAGDALELDPAATLDAPARYQRFLAAYALTGDENARPGDVGLDSLAMAELMIILETAVAQAGAEDLQDDLHLPIVQRLTIAEISALFRDPEESAADWASRLRADLTEWQRERAENEAAAMRADAVLGPLDLATVPRAAVHFGQVLLTGATGFLGPFLLRSLLDQTSATYTVLMRAADPAAGRERLQTALATAGLLDARTAAEFATRVRVICGDVASPRLGLSAAAWSELAQTTDTIIHNAALVDYVLDYQALRAANVEATRELIALACTAQRKQLNFVSSTTIFGWSDKRNLFEHDSNPEMLGLDFGYAQTKWVGEQLILQAREQGVEATIYRPAFVTASTAAFGHSSDIVVRLLSFMIKYGIAPNADIQLSFMPVDIAAHNIVAVMTSAGAREPVFHVTVDEYYNIVDVTTQINKDHGVLFRYVDLAEFSRQMKILATAEDPVFPLVDFVARAHSKVVVMEGKRYRNTAFRQAIDRSGAGAPLAGLQETMSYLMTYLKAQGVTPQD